MAMILIRVAPSKGTRRTERGMPWEERAEPSTSRSPRRRLPRFTAAIGRVDDEEGFRGGLPERGQVVLGEDAAEEDADPWQGPGLDHLGGTDADGVVSHEFISHAPYKGGPFHGPSPFRAYPAPKAGVLI